MKIIISPAKKMNVDTDMLPYESFPVFMENTEKLMKWVQKLTFEQARKLWVCNEKIAELNFRRFAEMDLKRNLTPALISYEGIQYQCMAPSVFSREARKYVQKHLRILSGFYGVLKPLDGVTPYRLEMQAKAGVDGSGSLYEFWGDKLYREVRDESRVIVNLASKEYSRCVENYLRPGDRFVTCVFGEWKNGKILQKGTQAKMARGEMVRFMAELGVEEPDQRTEKVKTTAAEKKDNTIKRALKNKNIWLVSLNIFFVYSVYCGLTYFIPFLEEAYALPAALVGVYGIINRYGLKMLGEPVGGFITDKVLHSTTKYLRICFVIVAGALVIFACLPHKQLGVVVGMAITLSISAFIFSMRAIFFAPMDEVKVPRDITGSAMSIGFFVGYLPGAFMYAVYGAILDHAEGLAGYRIVFFVMAAFAVVGFFLSAYILRTIKKQKESDTQSIK